ncbi:hypothetical protein EHI42_11820 [Rhizobium hidalgonense]|nr:hypothetical protein EHI42_11820 [Rhizobium hidalgonense]
MGDRSLREQIGGADIGLYAARRVGHNRLEGEPLRPADDPHRDVRRSVQALGACRRTTAC